VLHAYGDVVEDEEGVLADEVSVGAEGGGHVEIEAH